MSEFKLPESENFRTWWESGDEIWLEAKKIVDEYGRECAKAALEEVAVRMRNSADQNVAKWEEVGDDEDVIHAKSAAFAVYVHAASIRKFAEEIT